MRLRLWRIYGPRARYGQWVSATSGRRNWQRRSPPASPSKVNQLGYGLLNRIIEFEVLPVCRQHGIGVAAYMPLMQGLLTGRWRSADEIPHTRRRTRHFAATARHANGEPGGEAEVSASIDGIARLAEAQGMPMADMALASAAAQPGVTMVIVGTRTPAQLDESLRGIGRTLSPDVLAELDRLTQPVKAKLGSNADLWQCGGEQPHPVIAGALPRRVKIEPQRQGAHRGF